MIYDHERDDWGGAEYQIKQGTVVHEQRVVIRLPDPKQMQVVAKVAESRIDRIKVGMPAKIEIEGLPGVELKGKVTRVNEYPAADNWFNAGVKEYATTVQVIDPPAGLRPGMTAHVAIRVETIDDALQVPIQAVVERGGRYYCLRERGRATRTAPGPGRLDQREVPGHSPGAQGRRRGAAQSPRHACRRLTWTTLTLVAEARSDDARQADSATRRSGRLVEARVYEPADASHLATWACGACGCIRCVRR